MRLRRIFFNYKKVTEERTYIQFYYGDNAASSAFFTDESGSGWKVYEGIVDSLSVQPKTRTLQFRITEPGFLEWGSLRADYRPIMLGQRAGR